MDCHQINRLKQKVLEFRNNRDWKQFHNPKDLAQGLSIEAAELLELFLWISQEASYQTVLDKRDQVEAEMADIFIYLLLLSDATSIDLEEAVLKKLDHNHKKYPVELAKGLAKKYTELSAR